MLQYFETLTDSQGNSLYGAIVTVYTYPGLALASIYSTNGTASPIANSAVTSDITGQVSFYVPDGAYQLTYTYKGTVYKTKAPVQMLDPMGYVPATDSGTANAYVVTGSQYPASLYTGLKLTLQAANTNLFPGTSTLNLNSTGAQNIVIGSGANVQPGHIEAGGVYQLTWTGAAWQLTNPTPNDFSQVVSSAESRTNTTVLANSIYLTGVVQPGTYEYYIAAAFNTPSGAGFQFELVFSGTAVATGFLLSGVYGSNSNAGQINSSILTVNTPVTIAGGTNTSEQLLVIQGTITVTAAGTLAFAFAQATANASATVLSQGSYAKLKQLA